MGPSAALQLEYRRCVEGDFRRGRAGVCADPALRASLRQRLLEEPELHRALQNDAFATLASSLRGQDDLPQALRGLARAFEVLELAAVNLHLFPWRREFSTVKMFSGVYVHSLQAALADTDIARSFRRMGYVRRDDQHLVVSCPPPAAELVQAACGFFAARVECEILGEILRKLGPCRVSAEDLLQVRRGTRALDDCVEKLQGVAGWPTGRGPGAQGCDESVDLYRDELENPEDLVDPMEARLHSSHWGLSSWEQPRPPIREQSPPLWSKPVGGRYPEDLRGNKGRFWDKWGATESGWEQPYRNGPDPEAASFSFMSWRKELSRGSDSVSPERAGRTSPFDSAVLEPLQAASCLQPCSAGTAVPSAGRVAHSWSETAERPWEPPPGAAGLEGSSGEVPEPPCYQLHSCLSRGALPSYCCATCYLLHARGCEAVQACRGSHHMQELQSETQKRMWLQRTEVDMLLNKGSGARP
ncbi:spermatogenesis-associated protein 2-like protein isoform X1 [Pelodiscus sinensis]